MEDEPEVIRQRMEETRTALSEKLEALEMQVVGVMGGATEAVSDTVETVKDSVASVKDAVHDTVKSIRSAFDIPGHFEHQPWLMFGGAVLVGFFGSRLMGSRASGVAVSNSTSHAPMPFTSAPAAASMAPAAAPAVSYQQKPSLLDGALGDALGSLKSLAVGAAMGVLRDMASEQLPEAIGKSIADTVDDLTTKLGGKKLPAMSMAFVSHHEEESPSESGAEQKGAGFNPAPFTSEESFERNRKPATAGRK